MSMRGRSKVSVAIIGSGNIGTDLMMKVLRHGQNIEVGAMVGIDEGSDGLARAARLGIATTSSGIPRQEHTASIMRCCRNMVFE
jgi:acetaldehyde dehydrogenase